MHIFSNTDVNKDLNPLKLFALEIENTGSPTLCTHSGEGHGEGILIGLFNSKSTAILVGLFNSNFLKRPPGLDRA